MSEMSERESSSMFSETADLSAPLRNVTRYAPPGNRERIATGENLKRIAEFIARLTWREAETMAEGVQKKLSAESRETKSLSSALIEWAEDVQDGEHSKTV